MIGVALSLKKQTGVPTGSNTIELWTVVSSKTYFYHQKIINISLSVRYIKNIVSHFRLGTELKVKLIYGLFKAIRLHWTIIWTTRTRKFLGYRCINPCVRLCYYMYFMNLNKSFQTTKSKSHSFYVYRCIIPLWFLYIWNGFLYRYCVLICSSHKGALCNFLFIVSHFGNPKLVTCLMPWRRSVTLSVH